MPRYLTRLILLLVPGFFASGEAFAMVDIRAPQNDLAGQKNASGIFFENIAILRHLAATQAIELQQEKSSAVRETASAPPLAAEGEVRRCRFQARKYPSANIR